MLRLRIERPKCDQLRYTSAAAASVDASLKKLQTKALHDQAVASKHHPPKVHSNYGTANQAPRCVLMNSEAQAKSQRTMQGHNNWFYDHNS